MVDPIPEGFRSVTPHLVIKNAAEAIEFYKKAFNAVELSRMPAPDGSVMHAEIKIGDCIIMIGEDMPQMRYWVSPTRLNGTATALSLYTEDADALMDGAVAAGAKVSLPLSDAFWGDRYGRITDPFGHEWEIMTHLEDLTPEEIGKRAKAFFAGLGD